MTDGREGAAARDALASAPTAAAPRGVAMDPVVVGALGGSGTRVVARVLRDVGVFMGSHVDGAEDSRPLVGWYDTWARRLLEGGGHLAGSSAAAAGAAFGAAVAQHLRDLPDPETPWGLKVPRSILFLGWWTRVFPRLRFVHVLRDGLDMAYSADMNQLRLYGDLLLSRAERRLEPRVRAMAYWSRAKLRAADFAEASLGARYLRLRFEDLCRDPSRTVARLVEFLGLTGSAPVDAALGEVVPPPTIGRWREGPASELRELMRTGRPALERFSYWDPDAWERVDRVAGAPGGRGRLWPFRRRSPSTGVRGGTET